MVNGFKYRIDFWGGSGRRTSYARSLREAELMVIKHKLLGQRPSMMVAEPGGVMEEHPQWRVCYMNGHKYNNYPGGGDG